MLKLRIFKRLRLLELRVSDLEYNDALETRVTWSLGESEVPVGMGTGWHCSECDASFGTERGLAVHKGRMHK